MNRRGFIQTFGGWSAGCMAAQCAGQSILQTLVHGMLTKAYAQSQGVDPRFFVDVYIGGGFHAPFFYLPLNPYNSQSVTYNTWNTNQWASGAPVYAPATISVAGETVRLPPVWGGTIPRHADWGGGFIPASEVAQHSMFFRGFRNAFDSHETNRLQIVRPDASQPSIAGVIADQSKKPVPAVHLNNYTAGLFASKKIGVKSLYSGGSTISPLVTPFSATAEMNALLSRKDAFQSAFQNVMVSVAADAKRIGAEDLITTIGSAESLIRQNLGSLSAEYYTLATKYSNLIKSCGDLTGILTEAISPGLDPADPDYLYRRWSSNPLTILTNADLRTIVTTNSTIQTLSDGFALAEFLMKYDLSHAVMFTFQGPSNLNLQYAPGGTNSWTIDMHDHGIGAALAPTAFMGRAYAACLYEFYRRAMAAGRQDEIVCKVGSEFSRSPRHDGTGADHGWEANCMMLFSGAIKKPAVLGNIVQGSETGTYRGTWGKGAVNNHEGNSSTILNMGHYASTLANAIGITSPTSNFLGLVTMSSDREIVPAIDKGETIA